MGAAFVAKLTYFFAIIGHKCGPSSELLGGRPHRSLSILALEGLKLWRNLVFLAKIVYFYQLNYAIPRAGAYVSAHASTQARAYSVE